jgi:hypothetical protein
MSEQTITLRLKPWSVKHLVDHETTGGFQNYHRRLLEKVQNAEGFKVSFSEQELGELIRHMGYGQGGFQGMLRKAFTPALLRQIGYE